MTWDHVPPKSCFNNLRTEYNRLFGELQLEKELQREAEKTTRYDLSQNGIKFRTICKKCNRDLLGANYDKELKKFVDITHTSISTTLTEHRYQQCELNANKIARSVVGHLLAAKTEYDEHTEVDLALRQFFLTDKITPPEDMSLLYYVYPHPEIVIARDYVIGNLKDSENELPKGLISSIYSYPVAFILCNDETSCGLKDLFSYCSEDINAIAKICIDLSSYKHEDGAIRNPSWPVNLSKDRHGASFVIGGKYMDESIISSKRNIER